MNKSLETVLNNTTDPVIKTWAKFLTDNAGKRFCATFEKQNGEVRDITFVPRNQYNTLMGIETTDSGRKMVITKANRNMLTIVEFYRPEGCVGYHESVRCRTLNLAKLITLKVAA